MIDMISNYEKAKISMARVFLQYDQAAMIHKYSLEYDSGWLYITLCYSKDGCHLANEHKQPFLCPNRKSLNEQRIFSEYR